MTRIMNAKISFKSLVNGEIATVIYNGLSSGSTLENWKDVRSLLKPLTQEGIILTLDTGEETVICVDGSPFILPSCEQVLIISDQNIESMNRNQYYKSPNNAAIYNADGSLRHQLINPKQEKGWYIHSTYYADLPSLKGFGVMVTNDHEWPELCFCLYDGTPNLIWTGYQLDRR